MLPPCNLLLLPIYKQVIFPLNFLEFDF